LTSLISLSLRTRLRSIVGSAVAEDQLFNEKMDK